MDAVRGEVKVETAGEACSADAAVAGTASATCGMCSAVL